MPHGSEVLLKAKREWQAIPPVPFANLS